MRQVVGGNTPQLDYGHTAPVWRRRRVWRWGIRAAVAGAALWASYIYIPLFFQRSAIVYWQKQCFAYTASPSQVVFEDDPVEVSKLLKSAGGYTSSPNDAAVIWPGAWDQLFDRGGAFGAGPQAILFLHRLTTKGGQTRLVCVTFEDANNIMIAEAIEPASRFRETGMHGWSVNPQDVGWTPPGKGKRRFYAGQIDPSDGTHFTIVFESGGRKQTFDGWLLDDRVFGVTIKFSLKPPATTSPAGS